MKTSHCQISDYANAFQKNFSAFKFHVSSIRLYGLTLNTRGGITVLQIYRSPIKIFLSLFVKQMDNFFKEVQESVNSIRHPKGLSEASCQLMRESPVAKWEAKTTLICENNCLRLGPKDDFGGLHQEPRDGIGAIWVCDKHRMYAKDERFLKVMP